MRASSLVVVALVASLTLTLLWILTQSPGGSGESTTRNPASAPAEDLDSTPVTAATSSDPAPASREAAPPHGEASSSTVSVGAATTARGRFVDKSGSPVEGVKIYKTLDTPGIVYADIDRLPNLASEPFLTRIDGVFRWVEPGRADNAAPGITRFYRVAVGLKRVHARVKLTMELVYETETPLGDFVLEPGGDIAGVVRDPEGRPFEGAIVKLVDAQAFASSTSDPRLFRPIHVKGHRRAQTQVDGSFAMAGAPVGLFRLVADHDNFGVVVSDAFSLQAGDVLDAFVLALRAPPPESMVKGKVVDPAGVGVYATVEVSYASGGASFQTSPDGTFRWRCTAAGPYTFLANDIKKKFGGARSQGIDAGARDLRLVLTERRDLVLEMVNDAGEPIREGSVNLVRKEGMHSLDLSVRPFDPPGRAVLPVPPTAFVVEVRSPGHVQSSTATIDPANVPQPLRVVLPKLPAIEGRVVSRGKSVKGVWVALQMARMGARRDGFPARHGIDPMAGVAPVETGDDGTFSIAPSGPVKLVFLRVSSTRFDAFENARNALDLAPAEFGPFDYDGRAAVKGIEIAMTQGGGIAGKLLLTAGRSPAGQSIGASNGDSHPVTTKTRDNGAFEFVQLTPGRYEVKWIDGVDYGERASSTPPAEVVAVPWNCVVEEGAVTAFDLDYSRASDPEVLLEVKLGNLVPAGAKVRLEVGAPSGGPAAASDAVLDSEGRARIPLPRGGDVKITISYSSPAGVDYGIQSIGTVDAHGESRLAVTIPAGVLRGTVPASVSVDTKLTFDKPGSQPYIHFTVGVKPGAPFEIVPAPAGPVSVKFPDGKIVKTTVLAGGVTEIAWP